MSFFNKDAFMQQAKAAQAMSPAGGAATRRSSAAVKIKISKDLGTFIWFPNNDKNAIANQGRSLKGIIVRQSFNLVQFAKDVQGGKPICRSTGYFMPGSTQMTRGTWPIPYDHKFSIDRYNPVGSKGMNCSDCVAQNLQGSCESRGFIEIVVYMVDNQMVTPFLALIELPLTSQIEFQNYILNRVVGELESAPFEVVTQLDIVGAMSKGNIAYKKVTFTLVDKATEQHAKMAEDVVAAANPDAVQQQQASAAQAAPAAAQATQAPAQQAQVAPPPAPAPAPAPAPGAGEIPF